MHVEHNMLQNSYPLQEKKSNRRQKSTFVRGKCCRLDEWGEMMQNETKGEMSVLITLDNSASMTHAVFFKRFNIWDTDTLTSDKNSANKTSAFI